MSRFLFALFVALAVFSVLTLVDASKAANCGKNEVWESCRNSDMIALTWECRIGCRCKFGFVRNSVGDCVPPTEFAAKLYGLD